MPMQQIIYASRPFGYSLDVLAGILATARLRNARYNITGALICRSDIYLQLLEGPTGKTEEIFQHITEDDRHTEVELLVRARVHERLFPDWAMHHDPAETWLWPPDEIRNGVLSQKSAREIRGIFVRSAMSLDSQSL
ncbi:BLUF domain-containing protein [Roseobacter sp.]|uniref:BLUF domain-containing protein n=1 Tax=Roseobacter sp. TaxID=1907202 RepID=UPI0025D1C2A3|nr:BLUF domain-containing protein [Roseobacter sp.]